MIQYQIALINVFWDKSDINTRYFETTEDQQAYFEELTRGKFSPLVNFNMGNNIETRVIYKDVSGRSVEELISCNYAVVQKIENDNVISQRYYFAQPSQDSNIQMSVILTLDDIQTNFIPYQQNIAPCLIKKACLERFIKNEDNTYKFNNTLTSKLFSSELYDLPKISKKREKLVLKFTGDENVDNWLNENVRGWLYVFVSPEHQFKFYENNGTTELLKTLTLSYGGKSGSIEDTPYNSNVACICVPLTKGISKKVFYNDLEISSVSIENFKFHNNDTSYFYSYKMSMIAPFNTNTQCTISNGNLEITQTGQFEIFRTSVSGDLPTGVITNITQDMNKIETYPLTLDLFNFTLDEIKGNHIKKLNPKINSFNTKRLRLTTNNGDYFDYDLQKLGENELIFEYTETIQPEVTKAYCRIKTNTGLYLDPTERNYTGLIVSVDNSIPYTNNQYANFIANNKNFWQQSNLKIFSSTIGSVAQNTKKLDIVGLLGNLVDVSSQSTQLGLTADNMVNAPDSLTRASGNVLFNIMVDELAIYVDIYEAIEQELNMFDMLTTTRGFTLNLIDNISNYVNLRKYFNYIEADVEVINAPLSPLEKQRLQQSLKSVRFWNTDTIDYTLENYERSLDNE